MKCVECGSYAINHQLHGRDGSDLDLCDVCYWRKRAAPPQAQGDDDQCAARYRWLRDNRHLGAWFSAGFSHLEYGQNIDADIDEAMIEDVARKAGV